MERTPTTHLRRFLAAIAGNLAAGTLAFAAAQDATPRERFDALAQRGKALEQALVVVERIYVDNPDSGERKGLKKRFSDAETRFLVQDYEKSAALFYALVGNKAFAELDEEFGESLYMLAESLYQGQRFHGARTYFREYLNRGKRNAQHYEDALLRYIGLAARFNDFAGVSEYTRQVRQGDGTLPPEVAYAYGKWAFIRKDVPEERRQKEATEYFQAVLKGDRAFVHQSLHFLGVLAVQRGDLDAASKHFEAVLKRPAQTQSDRLVQEQAHLALARIHMEKGEFDLAIDRYQNVDYRSDAFLETMYEVAWAYVRRARAGGGDADYRKALQAAERLVASAPDSLEAPDARVLQGHLYLRLGKYQEAEKAYRDVVEKFQPAHDDLARRLAEHPDPVQFFQKAIASSDKTFDLESFLPKFAIPWATTESEIAEAVQITGDIDVTREAIHDSLSTVRHLLEQLDSHQEELFPFYQKGIVQAQGLDSELSALQGALVDLESQALKAAAPGDDATFQKLDRLRDTQREIERELAAYPQTEAEHARWRQGLTKRITALEQEAHRVSIEAESLFAIQTAIEKLLKDGKGLSQRDRSDFTRQLAGERMVAQAMRGSIASTKREVAEAKARLELLRPNNSALLGRYANVLLDEQRELELLRKRIPGTGISPDEAAALHRSIGSMRVRTAHARDLLKARISEQSQAVRRQIMDEADRLRSYGEQSKASASQTRGLIGSIAYQSFQKVLRRFYDAMVKAEVGIVDIAWTRKQRQTERIQTLATQQSNSLQELKRNFKEALDDGN